jgi:hypothetical protein
MRHARTRVSRARDGCAHIRSCLSVKAVSDGMIGAMRDRPYRPTDLAPDIPTYVLADGWAYTVVYTKSKEAFGW